jgi:hypothetical protein
MPLNNSYHIILCFPSNYCSFGKAGSTLHKYNFDYEKILTSDARHELAALFVKGYGYSNQSTFSNLPV